MNDQHELPLADDLLIGADKIAEFIYGEASANRRRDVYRNVLNFSIFRHGSALAALKSSIRAELAEMQQAAREQRLKRLQEAQRPRAVIKPRRRIRSENRQEV